MEVRAKKRFGQNFLKDNNVLNKIYESVKVETKDLIIEIGPGKGALTKLLKSYNCDIIAFEIDQRLTPILNELSDEKTSIVYKDFLSVNLSDYIKKNYQKIHVIANIPYYITGKIIQKLVEGNIDIVDITLMVQKEVADRICAHPGSKDYGSFTIFCNLNYDVNKIIDVSKQSFDPVPKVDSAVVKFSKNKKYNINDYQKFSKLIKDSFAMKRKTLKNNLKSYDWLKIYSILKEYNYPENIRAEEIPIDVFVKIANNM